MSPSSPPWGHCTRATWRWCGPRAPTAGARWSASSSTRPSSRPTRTSTSIRAIPTTTWRSWPRRASRRRSCRRRRRSIRRASPPRSMSMASPSRVGKRRPASLLRRRRHRRHQAPAAVPARCRALRREGLPATRYGAPPGRRSRHPLPHRGGAHRARCRRPRALLTQRLSLGGRARGSRLGSSRC